MDSSVRFAATRDALLRQNAQIVYSIEPFSISVDIRQSSKISNTWRVAKDIGGSFVDTIDRAGQVDKWSPLAGPGAWPDPDMMNIGTQMTDGENRALFGLWAIQKSTMLLSADLPNLPASLQAIINSPEVISTNQDDLGIPARRLMLDGRPMPWYVGLEDCSSPPGGGVAGMASRNFVQVPGQDTRVWSAVAHGSVAGAVALVNTLTGRCLVPGSAQGQGGTVVLLPCNASDAQQAWNYGTGGSQTVSALVHNASGLALQVGNSTLFSTQHGDDQAALPDAAYGETQLTLVPFPPTEPCTRRDCEGYHPDQLWYGPDVVDHFIAHATYTASINHCFTSPCYELSKRTPTYAHFCLAHVLSVHNGPTDSGTTEVWGGPLAGGAYVLGLLNQGSVDAQITAPFSAYGVPGVGDGTQFCVRSLWAPAANVGAFTGGFTATVPKHDLIVYKLTPGAC